MRQLHVVVLVVAVIVSIGDSSYRATHKAQQTITGLNPLRVAHAGGGIENATYTNSYEALNSNYNKGFLYFELDFVFTTDGRLVCLHDWGNTFKRTFGFETSNKVTLEEFERLVRNRSKFTNCTLDGLAVWMQENPLSYIVTDVKEDNIKALEIIYETLPSANERVIPQIYQPHNFDAIKKIGFEEVIWTLYRFGGDNSSVLEWLNNFSGSIAIATPKSRAESALPKTLAKRQIPTYVHTVNSIREFEKFTTVFGITEI